MKSKSKKEQQKAASDSQIHDSCKEVETLESNVDTSFFYTNDKFINSFDNDEIIAKIKEKYNELNDACADSSIKKNIVHFLNDEKFVEQILRYYNISIFELFKILYKEYGSIFKGPYLKKIRKTLSNKKYAENNRRKTDY